jgi:hypothetical protein
MLNLIEKLPLIRPRMSIFSTNLLLSVNHKIRSLLPTVLAIVVLGLAIRAVYFAQSISFWDVDFFAIWSFAKFVFGAHVAEIYDNSKLLDFQMDLGGYPIERPYAYPPSFLLMILPLSFLSFPLAFITWNIFTFSIYFVASFHRRWRISAILLIIFSPAAIQNAWFGQTGFLSAALILGGFRLVATRPLLSGTLFGLASFKPQLGVLIPLALISARLWRPLVAASATVAVLIVASSLAFGWSIWPMWLAKLPAHAEWSGLVSISKWTTITASLIVLGSDLEVARIIQIAGAIIVAAIIWACFRRGITLLATAALLVGAVLATPYALVYDLPILTNSVLIFIRHKDLTNRLLTIPEAAVLLLSLLVPESALQTWRPALMFRSVPLLLLFGIIVRDLFRSRGAAALLEEER